MAHSFSIHPIDHSDIDALAKISGDAFITDRHTQMKALGKVPYVHEDGQRSALASFLASPKCSCIQAVSNVTGEAMGWCAWGFRGFERDEVPRLEPFGEPREGLRSTTNTAPGAVVADEKAKTEDEKDVKAKENDDDDEDDDIVKRLEAMTDADMTDWMEKLMPEGTKCMYVVTLVVAPEFQSRGVGSALLRWGTENADKFGVFAWVHSSEPAWKLYEKAGFEVIGKLDVDLDAWAPAPPPEEEGEGAVWGHYIFRYMKRLPRKG